MPDPAPDAKSEAPVPKPVPAPDRFLVRLVRPQDAEALRELRLEALRLHPAAFTSDLAQGEARPMEWWRELTVRKGGAGPSALFVAAEGERLVGMAGMWGTDAPKQAHRGDVFGVYVRDEARGHRLGDRLLAAAALDWGKARGMVLVTLGVVVGNDAAKRCYERAGFTVFGVQPMVVRVGGVFYDEYLMAKRL